jgi:hypothetical protein
MGLLGKWFFCVRCQYFYPNRTVLENHQVTQDLSVESFDQAFSIVFSLSFNLFLFPKTKTFYFQSEEHAEVAKVILVHNVKENGLV